MHERHCNCTSSLVTLRHLLRMSSQRRQCSVLLKLDTLCIHLRLLDVSLSDRYLSSGPSFEPLKLCDAGYTRRFFDSPKIYNSSHMTSIS